MSYFRLVAPIPTERLIIIFAVVHSTIHYDKLSIKATVIFGYFTDTFSKSPSNFNLKKSLFSGKCRLITNQTRLWPIYGITWEYGASIPMLITVSFKHIVSADYIRPGMRTGWPDPVTLSRTTVNVSGLMACISYV